MYSLGIIPNDFNPQIMFSFKCKLNHSSKLAQVHQHEFLTINYITSGTCDYIINDKSYLAKKGDIIILNPFTSHYKEITSTEDVSIFHFGLNDIEIKGVEKNRLQTSCPVLSIKKYKQELYNCYHEIMTVQEKKDIGWELLNKALILKFLIIILKELSPINSEKIEHYFNFETYDKHTVVETIITYINENYMKKVSIEQFSQSTYLSSNYISKIFKEITGDTLINYLINLRIEKAKQILEEGHFTIQEVSQKVGYEDPYYFSKLFKKKYGCSPSEYKAQKEVI
ncbi:AraC family transcriptional regulator [Vallitalea okinawensis]|uniref:AraC family transcriptional regulator n=1 Tax=Vallitalea okinawensis TaxID=2078660 RepID=UPI000CFE258E|nr:AraC family transcriptional regulator [Vallitalea okinawensis]